MFEDSNSPDKDQNPSNFNSDQKTETKIKPESKKIGLKVTMGLVVAILVMITIYISGIKNKHKSEMYRIRGEYDLLRDKNATIKKVKLQRVEFFSKQAFLTHPALSAFTVANFIQKLSLITPRNLNLLQLNLKPLNQNIGFILKGMVVGTTEAKNRQIFADFYQRMDSLDEVIQIFSSSLKPVDKNQKYIGFSIRGELEVE